MLVKKTYSVLWCQLFSLSISNRVELPPNIKWEYQTLICSNATKLSHFSLSVYHPFSLLAKFSHLTSRQNESCPGGEIFRKWTRWNIIFFLVRRKTTKKLFSYEQPVSQIILQNNCSEIISGFKDEHIALHSFVYVLCL